MSYLNTQTDTRGVTTITLDRPDTLNAMNREFIDEFILMLKNLDSNTRILVIQANGKHFCAGADIKWMQQSTEISDEQNHSDSRALASMLEAIDSFACPTIARVHGAAYGGGTGIVSCCDIVVAAEDSSFAFPEVRLGLMPATVSPFAIAAIGARAARRYFLTGEHIDVLEAYRLGLVHDVCSTDNLSNRVEEKIAALLCGGPQAQASTKQLITHVAASAMSEQLHEDMASRLSTTRTSAETREGLRAFLDKREPQWD